MTTTEQAGSWAEVPTGIRTSQRYWKPPMDGSTSIRATNTVLGEHITYHRRVAWSKDGGGSFSPSLSDAGLPEPRCQANVCRYTLAGDGPPEQGKNRVLFTNPGTPQQHERNYLRVRLSYDEMPNLACIEGHLRGTFIVLRSLHRAGWQHLLSL